MRPQAQPEELKTSHSSLYFIYTGSSVCVYLDWIYTSKKLVQNSPSLNEAAYAGINLLNDLVQLLIKVRKDEYLMISDIKAAFLNIKLSLETDKNKFCILWKAADNRLIAYRYTSIVFGFSSSRVPKCRN